MERDQFDALTRQLSGAGTSRRHLLRTLAGGLLGGALAGVAARLGLTADAAARSRSHKRKRKTRHAHHAATTAQAGRRPGGVQSEGKGKKKKHTKPKPPKPQICSLFECVDQGGKCCPDGSCVNRLVCCPGEKQCGEQCVPATACCPGETPCADGSCPAPGQCCKEEYRCDDGTCIAPLDECCPRQKRCDNGACVASDACCPGSGVDACHTCPAGSAFCGHSVGWDWFDLPHGCCPADRYFPDRWWGTGKYYCAQPDGPGSVWAQCN